MDTVIRKRKILIVDDKPENIHFLASNLEDDYDVIHATKGEQVLDIVRSNDHIDLILLDILMPEMDGYDVCETLKENPDSSEIPVMFITSMGREEGEEKGLSLGAVDYISRPFKLAIVRARISSILKLKEVVDQGAEMNLQLQHINENLEKMVDEKVEELRQAHQALERSEYKYRSIFQNALNGIIQINANGRILSANPAMARILGYGTPAELIRSVTDFEQQFYINDSDRSALYRILKNRDHVTGFEIRVRRKDGSTIWIMLSLQYVRDVRGQLVYIEGSCIDITVQKEMGIALRDSEDRFRQAQKLEAVGTFVGGMAHDFNNTLSVINGLAELSMEMIEPADTIYNNLEEILNASMRSADIIRQLLAFARQQNIVPKVLDLNESISSMQKMLQLLIGEEIAFVWIPGDELWTIKIDPTQIHQILANLCVNAKDAIDGSGKVTIETANSGKAYCAERADFIPGEFVLLTVSDDGGGLVPGTSGKIFEPFFTTKATGKGTGLGLSTVYGIVKQNSGFINIHSVPERGTSFSIYLPRYTGVEVEVERQEPTEIPFGQGQTILLVEDNKTLLAISRIMLENLGYTVLAAENPLEAVRLAIAHASSISLLLTDVVMPTMNGRELSERVTKIQPNIKTVYMSGYMGDALDRKGMQDGKIEFIQKPFSKKDLAVKIRLVLDNLVSDLSSA